MGSTVEITKSAPNKGALEANSVLAQKLPERFQQEAETLFQEWLTTPNRHDICAEIFGRFCYRNSPVGAALRGHFRDFINRRKGGVS